MPDIDHVSASVLAAAKQMYARGLVEGTAGNVSGRVDADRVVVVEHGGHIAGAVDLAAHLAEQRDPHHLTVEQASLQDRHRLERPPALAHTR